MLIQRRFGLPPKEFVGVEEMVELAGMVFLPDLEVSYLYSAGPTPPHLARCLQHWDFVPIQVVLPPVFQSQ